MQQVPSEEETLYQLAIAEDLVKTFAARAKRYWSEWGPLGEPTILLIDAWVEGQLLYLEWLRQSVQEFYRTRR